MAPALLGFVARGFSSDVCHIKARPVIMEVRFSGGVQQGEILSFLSPALMSFRVCSLLLLTWVQHVLIWSLLLAEGFAGNARHFHLTEEHFRDRNSAFPSRARNRYQLW